MNSRIDLRTKTETGTGTFADREIRRKGYEKTPPVKVPGPDTLCPDHGSDGSGPEDQLIHLIDASGERCLFPRHVCAIEAASRANPLMHVTVYTHSGAVDPPPIKRVKSNLRNCNITDRVLGQLANVHLVHDDLYRYLTESKFHPVLQGGRFKSTYHQEQHLLDAAKLAIVRKHGGVYLDLDFLTLRPLHCLKNSMTYLPSNEHVSNGAFALDRGHIFLGFAIRFLAMKYDATQRDSLVRILLH